MKGPLILSAIALTVAAALGGCASHHHHDGVKSVRVLEAEHGDRHIVVVRTRPARSRQCWKHRSHWHCHRR